jgi:glycosyltransferase involved in cell wall biosynthesis
LGLDYNVVIITAGLGNKKFMEGFAKLIRTIFDGEIFFITAGDFILDQKNFKSIKLIHLTIPYADNHFGRIKSYLSFQFSITKNIPKHCDVYLFFLSQTLILPLLCLKSLRKTVFLVLGSSHYKVSMNKGGLNLFLPHLEKLAFELSNYIFLYSNNLKKEFNLENYEKKIKIVHRHYLDFHKFYCFKPYKNREKLVGFIGRFSPEKGIINFIKSIPLTLKKDPEIQFLIIGEGILKSEVLNLIYKFDLHKKVNIIYNVDFEEIPFYLNQIKLLVVPSYTEGLPNIVIEAMACETPVLASCVGSIPDIISDQKTGFLLKNNHPEIIAKGVINALNDENIHEIIENSQKYVNNNFDFRKVLTNYEEIFKNILDNL